MLFRRISFEKHEPFLLIYPKDPPSLPTLLTHEHSMLPNPFPWWRARAKSASIHGEQKLGHATESNHIIIPCWWRWAQQRQRWRPWPPLKPVRHAETLVRFRRERPVYISYHVSSSPPTNSCPLLPTLEGRSAASFKVGQVLAPLRQAGIGCQHLHFPLAVLAVLQVPAADLQFKAVLEQVRFKPPPPQHHFSSTVTHFGLCRNVKNAEVQTVLQGAATQNQ